MKKICAMFAMLLALAAQPAGAQKPVTLLNVSYDPTREMYQEINRAFADYWKAKTGEIVNVDLSNGGSGKQAQVRHGRIKGGRGDAGAGRRY